MSLSQGLALPPGTGLAYRWVAEKPALSASLDWHSPWLLSHNALGQSVPIAGEGYGWPLNKEMKGYIGELNIAPLPYPPQ